MGKIKTGLLVIVAGLFVFLSAGSVTAATVSAPSNPEQISLTAYPTLTQEELVAVLAKQEKISRKTARRRLFPGKYSPVDKATFAVIQGELQPGNQDAGSFYLYCRTSEGELFHGLKEILYVTYQSGTDTFIGVIDYMLLPDGLVHMTINGNAAARTTTKATQPKPVGPGQAGRVQIKAKRATDFVTDVFIDRDYLF